MLPCIYQIIGQEFLGESKTMEFLNEAPLISAKLVFKRQL